MLDFDGFNQRMKANDEYWREEYRKREQAKREEENRNNNSLSGTLAGSGSGIGMLFLIGIAGFALFIIILFIKIYWVSIVTILGLGIVCAIACIIIHRETRRTLLKVLFTIFAILATAGLIGTVLYAGHVETEAFFVNLFSGYGKITIAIPVFICLFAIAYFIFRRKKESSSDFTGFTGRRKETLSDGVYEGDYVNGYWHGKGKMILENGMVYEGDFVEDKCHGKGKLVYINGDIYEGDFVNGYRQGKGKITFVDGGIYEGDFDDDKLQGKGKYTWPNGDYYEGDFVDDNFNGKGKITCVDGTIKEGNFKDGNFLEGSKTVPDTFANKSIR